MRIAVFCLCLAASSATSLPSVSRQQRIVGGEVTTIDRYPSAVALLIYDCFAHVYPQLCGGAILNKRSVLTAAHCIGDYVPIYYWNMRLGSSYSNAGGTVYIAGDKLIHPDYFSPTLANDIGIIYSTTDFEYNEYVASAPYAGRDYNLADDEPVWAVGWGIYNLTTNTGSEQLREVKLYTINWEKCNARYQENNMSLHKYMLCIGLFNIGGKDQCQGDSGSPVYHNNVIVGVCSWGMECGNALYPGVNMLVSGYGDWISANIK